MSYTTVLHRLANKKLLIAIAMKRSSHGINWVIVSVIFSLPRARALESGGLIETTDGDMLCDVSKSNHTVLPFSYQDIDGPGLTSYIQLQENYYFLPR